MPLNKNHCIIISNKNTLQYLSSLTVYIDTYLFCLAFGVKLKQRLLRVFSAKTLCFNV